MSINSQESILEQSDPNERDELEPLDSAEQIEQQNQQSDWTSGIDIVDLGSTVLDVMGDLLSSIDIDF